MNKIFIDTDIILDLFTKRDPFYNHAAKLFNLVDSGEADGAVLKKLKIIVSVLPVDDKIIDLALSSEFVDFEDAVQYYTAKMNTIDYIITRNVKDFKSSDIKALTADQFLNAVK